MQIVYSEIRSSVVWLMLHVCVVCSENMDWWIARHTATNAQGYIPSNYVVKDDNNPESQE